MRARLFHGWWVVFACFVCTMLVIGSTTYAFGLFVAPLSAEFGLSRADANGGLIVLLVGFALWAPIVGRLLDRAPARAVMVGGAVLFAVGTGLIAAASAPWMMAAAILGPLSLGTVAAGALAANTVTARWFHAQRGRAMGLLAVATSAGGFAMPPLVATLMTQFGWRGALAAQGAIVAIVAIAVVLLFVRDRPADLGLAPDGAATGAGRDSKQTASMSSEWPLARLLREPNFWFIGCGCGVLLAADQALLASMIPYGIDAGLDIQRASLLMSCLTFSAIVGKLAIGALADRVDKRHLFLVVAACNLGFLTVLLLGPDYGTLLVACSIIGLAIGGTYPLWMTMTADAFGSASFGAVMGTMNLVVMPFSIGSIRFVGEVFDRTGSYDAAFVTFMATAFVAAALILMVRPTAQAASAAQLPAQAAAQ